MRQEAVTVLKLETAQHDAAAAKSAQAIGQIGAAGQNSARQTAAAMRMLPAQFTDVATQLAGGQNPLMILLQQGGQVRDQFGSIGAAMRAIGTFITPTTLGVGVVAALGAAFFAAQKEAARLRDTLAITNNAAGLTPGSLQSIAQQVAANSETSVRGVKSIVLELAAQGTVSRRAMDDVALAVARVSDVTGKTASDVARDFAGMSRGVAQWALEHNRTYNFLTADVYRQIAALEQQGKTEEAMILISRRLTDQLEGQRGNLGYLERAWGALGRAAAGAWDAMLNVGRARTLDDRLEEARARAEQARRLRGGNDPITQEAEQQVQLLKENRRLLEQSARAQQDAAARNRSAVDEEAQRQAELARQRDAAKRGGARERERIPPPVTGEYLDRSDRLIPPATPDPLGEFIIERVLPGAAARDEQRLQQQRQFLQDLVDASASANLALITDDRERALAQIALDRNQLQRRIELIYEAGPQRAEAERQADEASAARIQASGLRFAKETAVVTREETRDALAAAFRDTKNPLRAFGDALGQIVFTRVSNSLADALVTAALGPATGGGGFLSGLGSFLGTLFGGGLAVGGGVRRGMLYEVNEGDSGPGEMLRTRSGRQYLMAAEDGEVVPYRPGRTAAAAPAAAAAAPTYVFNFNGGQHYGAGVSRAELAQQAAVERQATQALIIQTLQRERAMA